MTNDSLGPCMLLGRRTWDRLIKDSIFEKDDGYKQRHKMRR